MVVRWMHPNSRVTYSSEDVRIHAIMVAGWKIMARDVRIFPPMSRVDFELPPIDAIYMSDTELVGEYFAAQ